MREWVGGERESTKGAGVVIPIPETQPLQLFPVYMYVHYCRHKAVAGMDLVAVMANTSISGHGRIFLTI